MPRFKSIIFYQYSPKIKLFLKKKMQNFQALGAPPPNPRASGGWGFCPQTPKSTPLNCEFLATCLPRFALFIIVWVFVAFVLNNFFLHRSVANFMMLTIDICLIVCCLKSLICITHCVTLTPSCYIYTLSYLFAKV